MNQTQRTPDNFLFYEALPIRIALMTSIASPQGVQEPARFDFIDGLRGFAILGVLIVHSSQFVVVYGGGGPFRTGVLNDFINAGARGVQLFFMISAFTLFSSSKARFKTDSMPAVNFYVRRAFRILPLWWVTTAIYAYRTGSGIGGWLPSALMYFGFIRFRDGGDLFGPGWSIFVEETFYLLLPLVFTYITNLRRSVFFIGATLWLSILWESYAAKLGVPSSNGFIGLSPLSYWYCLATGITLFFFSEEPLFQQAVVDNRPWARIFDVIAAAALWHLIREPNRTASIALVALFIACMSPHTIFGKLARHKIPMLFGICCYSIYLLHLLAIIALSPYQEVFYRTIGLGRANTDIRFAVALPLISSICLCMGLVLWHGFERPCISLGRSFNDYLTKRRAREQRSSNAVQ